MKHEQETYGDAVERNRLIHEEALRRAHARNVEDAGELPIAQQLNWNSGDLVMTPSHVPSVPLTGLQSTPRVDSGCCGVAEICGLAEGSYRR